MRLRKTMRIRMEVEAGPKHDDGRAEAGDEDEDKDEG